MKPNRADLQAFDTEQPKEEIPKVERCTCPEDANKPYTCMKHEVHLCEECLACQDPSGYCKHRTACPIWYFERHPEEWGPQPQDPSSEDS